MARFALRSSPSDRRGIAACHGDMDNLLSGTLAHTPQAVWEAREDRRGALYDPGAAPTTVVQDSASGAIKTVLEVFVEPCVDGPENALTALGITRAPFQKDGNMSAVVEFATHLFRTDRVRAEVPAPLVANPSDPAASFLRHRGFRARDGWRQYVRILTPLRQSELGQWCPEAFEYHRLPFSCGFRDEFRVELGDARHTPTLAALRYELADRLGYETTLARVTEGVENLLRPRSDRGSRSELVVVSQRGKLVGTARVIPAYNPWEGMLQVGVRDVVLAPSFRRHGFLPIVFQAAVVAGRMLIHPDDLFDAETRVPAPIRVETWAPNARLAAHFAEEVPGLTPTGLQYFENF